MNKVNLRDGIYWRTVGDPTAPRVIWLHGLGESSRCFEAIAQELSGYQHILLDLPGYGSSYRPEQAGTLESLGREMAEWVRPLLPASLLGHSMGGVLGLLMAQLERFERFGNIEGNLTPPDCGYSGPIAAQSREDFLERGYQELLERLYQRGAEDKAVRGYFLSMSRAQPQSVYQHSHDLVRHSAHRELPNRLSELPIPVQYFAGAPGGADPAGLTRLRELGVPATTIEPSGHWPFIDQPRQFASELRDFLNGS